MDKLQVGRVMFPATNATEWGLQTLRNHVGNVTELTRLWDNQRAFQGFPPNLNRTRDWLIQAAEIHDMGKPQRFRLLYQQNKFNKSKWEWSYSFKGHRFDARHENRYVEKLAILHHEYSVTGITQAIAELRLHDDEAIKKVADNLPLDLYALEMCDQIEASMACTVLEDKEAESRVFMDFQFDSMGNNRFQFDPFPFVNGETVTLQMEYALIPPNVELIRKIMDSNCQEAEQLKLLRQLQSELVESLQTAPLRYEEVTLCPWI